jgi:hypothetical protein
MLRNGISRLWIAIILMVIVVLSAAWYSRDILTILMPWRNPSLGKLVYEEGLPKDWPIPWLKVPSGSRTYSINNNRNSLTSTWIEHNSVFIPLLKIDAVTISIYVDQDRDRFMHFMESQLASQAYRITGSTDEVNRESETVSISYVSPDGEFGVSIMTTLTNTGLICRIGVSKNSPPMPDAVYQNALPIVP